jgi:hypothetical protein
MHFDALFAKIAAARTSRIPRSSKKRVFGARRVGTTGAPSRGDGGAKMWRISEIGAARRWLLHQFKTTVPIARRC